MSAENGNGKFKNLKEILPQLGGLGLAAILIWTKVDALETEVSKLKDAVSSLTALQVQVAQNAKELERRDNVVGQVPVLQDTIRRLERRLERLEARP